MFYNFFKKSEPFLLAFHPSVVSHNVVVKFLWLSLCCHQRFALKGSGGWGAASLSSKKAHSTGGKGGEDPASGNYPKYQDWEKTAKRVLFEGERFCLPPASHTPTHEYSPTIPFN